MLEGEPHPIRPETIDLDRKAEPLGPGVQRDQLHPPLLASSGPRSGAPLPLGVAESIHQLPFIRPHFGEAEREATTDIRSILHLCRKGPFLDPRQLEAATHLLPSWARGVGRSFLAELKRYGVQSVLHLELGRDLELTLLIRLNIHTIDEARQVAGHEGPWWRNTRRRNLLVRALNENGSWSEQLRAMCRRLASYEQVGQGLGNATRAQDTPDRV